MSLADYFHPAIGAVDVHFSVYEVQKDDSSNVAELSPKRQQIFSDDSSKFALKSDK
jgi:hypothetical protein